MLCGVVQCGVVARCDVVYWHGTMWHDVVQCGVVRGMDRCDTAWWGGAVQCDAVRCGVAQYVVVPYIERSWTQVAHLETT